MDGSSPEHPIATANGIALAEPLEGVVARYFRLQHHWPTELAELGVSQPPTSRYVAAIDLDRGTLSITYGNRTNSLISGRVLSLRPTILAGRIAWICGYASAKGDDPVTGGAGPSRTDIDARDLPPACRSGDRISATIAPPAGQPRTSVAADDAGEPVAGFPITCSDARVTDVLRRAILTVGMRHAVPGSTVLLRVTAPFPPP